MKTKLLLFLFIYIPLLHAQDLNQNLLLQYNFDGNTSDNSSNGYNGTNHGAIYVDDRFGNSNSAIYFDGINDYVEFPNLTALKPDLPVSFSFWINYSNTASSNCEVFTTSYEEDVNSGVYFNSQVSNGNYAINFANGSNFYNSTARRSFVSTETIEPNEWHHIVVTVNSYSDMNIYVDCNSPTGTYSGTGSTLVYSDTPGCIGRRDRYLGAPANYFQGAIDDFRYWDRELSDAEINILCNSLSTDNFDITTTDDIKLNYNRSQNAINVYTPSAEILNYSLYNSFGQLISQARLTKNIPVSNIQKGLYMVVFDTTNGSKYTKKIVIN